MVDPIGYLGIVGSHSYNAAFSYFSGKGKFVGAHSFSEVFDGVTSGKTKYGVVPIENTLAGSIYENYDLLDKNSLNIVGEYYLRVKNCLAVYLDAKSTVDTSLKSIKKVYSHPKALEQCTDFFKKHPWIEACPHTDTAHAARFVSQQKDPTLAAIASRQAVDIYGLATIDLNPDDAPHNYTRFLVITKDQGDTSQSNKCSLIVRIPHVLGSFHKTLGVLEDHGCNLMKIESRPIKGKPFEYAFYLDFHYDASIHDIDKIIADLDKVVSMVKILGLYKESRP